MHKSAPDDWGAPFEYTPDITFCSSVGDFGPFPTKFSIHSKAHGKIIEQGWKHWKTLEIIGAWCSMVQPSVAPPLPPPLEPPLGPCRASRGTSAAALPGTLRDDPKNSRQNLVVSGFILGYSGVKIMMVMMVMICHDGSEHEFWRISRYTVRTQKGIFTWNAWHHKTPKPA